MNTFGILFVVVTSALLLGLPRNLAPLPLLIGTLYVPLLQQIELGGLHFPAIRLLIAVGFLRLIVNGERISGSVNLLDKMVLLWAAWAICSLAFHKPSVRVFRFGIVYDVLGAYYLFRVFIQRLEDTRTIFEMNCILLVPLAAVMLVEKLRGISPFGLIGFEPVEVQFVHGHFRAQGAFAHPILAGTVGALSIPMAFLFWKRKRSRSLAGMIAALAVVFATGASGPVMTAFSVVAAMTLWIGRRYLKAVLWSSILLAMAMTLVMKAPVYYLISRIDITGGSSGYFRSRLIESAVEHLDEWWVAGTDYTRHWMPSGITANQDHTDMTNYYLQMGVWGGFPLMLLFIGVLWVAFARVGQGLRANRNAPVDRKFFLWTLGAILFGHAITFISISYFDQTIVYLCLSLACIGSLPIPHVRNAWVPAVAMTRPRMNLVQRIRP